MSETGFEHSVLAADGHDQRLVHNVHPSPWSNPTPEGVYHLVVVGAGTAGLVSAAGSAGLGAKVALVERNLMGGDCLNVGCVPSKGVIRAARAWHEVRSAAERFGGPRVDGGESFAAAMERMRRIRADISKVDSAWRFRDELGIDVFLGQGRFVAADALEVDGRRLRFRRAVIATGARATGLPIPGLAEAGFLTNETLFTLTELPRRLAVIGAGPIGCEMAQSFVRFGSAVTLFDVAPQILIREDADAAALVQKALVKDGVELALGVQIEAVEKRDGAAVLRYKNGQETRELTADRILLSVGRAPNLEGLDLEAAGVQYRKQGVVVDEYLRTSNPRIYAAGDIAVPYQFTHIADATARIVIQNALFSVGPFGRAKWTDLLVPWCTYTSPEVAHVGMYEKDAREKGLELDTVTIELHHNDRALLDGEEEGFVRVHLKKGQDRIVGATIVAAHAGDLISELTLAIKAGVGLGAVASVIHPYPTQAEAIKRAADTWRRTRLTPTVAKLLKKRLGWLR
jgi:pyruvate/2-oxoglutarate dehydrogenase complex dihydrolipoamide dehydrogenase (E3) component